MYISAAVAVVASMAAAGGVASPAAAQAAQRPAIVPGNGAANGTAISVGIRNGAAGSGLNLGFDLGVGLATLLEAGATANSTALDLSTAYQLFGPAAACEGVPPVLGSLPPTDIASSGSPVGAGLQPADIHYPPMSGGAEGGLVGTQLSTSTATPSASGVTTLAEQDYGLFKIYNVKTEVTTSRVNGTRTSRAVVSADSMRVLDQALVINKPRWEAVVTDGVTSSQSGGFTSAGGTLLGFLPQTHDQVLYDLQNIGSVLGWLLGSLGFQLDLPKVITTTTPIEGGVKGVTKVSVTPLVFRFTDPPIGFAAIRGLLSALDPWIQESAAALQKTCEGKSQYQIFDMVTDILSGTGTISIAVGGVEASTDDVWFPPVDFSRPGTTPTTEAPPDTGEVIAQTEPTVAPETTERSRDSTPQFLGSVGDDETVAPETTIAAEATAAPPTTIAEAPSDEGDVVSFEDAGASRSFRPGKKGGRGTWLGLLALFGIGALALADRSVMQRSKRSIEP